MGIARALVVLALLGATAHAQHKHVAPLKDGPIGQTGVRYDKAEQTYETAVAMAADLRAPSAYIARARAESHAGVIAVNRILAALKEAHVKATRAAVEGVIKKSGAADTLYGSDGSVTLKFSLRGDALAAALAEASAAAGHADSPAETHDVTTDTPTTDDTKAAP